MDKQILTKATAPTEEPTAGWMFHAIAKMTKESPSACESVVDWLMRKIHDNSPHTKKKVLIIIKNVAQQGDADFARSLTKKTEILKSYASYRGQTDPLHGDALNQAVRVAAQQAVEAVFERNESGDRNRRIYEGVDSNYNQQPTGAISSWLGYGSNSGANEGYVNTTTNPSPYNSGIGSHSYTTGGIGSVPTSGGGKYQGMGNPMMQQQQPQSGSYLDTIKNYTPTLSGITSMFSRNAKPYGNDGASFLETDQSMGTYQVPVVPNGFHSTRGTFGGGSGGWEASPTTPVESGNSSNTLEHKLVEEFTSVSGVKLQPSRTEITQFVNKCANVDGEAVSELLHKKLKNKQWQVRLKALCAIEALLRARNDAVQNYFNDCYNEIGEYTEAVQDSVANKAKRVLKLLDAEDVEDEETSVTPNKHKTTPITPIEFEPQEPAVEYHKPKPTVQTPPPAKTVKQVSKPVQSAKQKELSPIFDPFEDEAEPEPEPQPRQPTGPKPITSIDDIFEGMSIREEAEQPKPVPQQQQPQPDRKRSDSSALMSDIGRFFDSQQPAQVVSPVSPPSGAKNLQQYPPSTLHQPQIVYVPVPMMQPMMQPVMGYPMQQMGGYPMQSMQPMMQQRMMQQSQQQKGTHAKGGFDFMNKGASDESETDIHFDFVKHEIAQSSRKT